MNPVEKKSGIYHLMTLLTVSIWGTTFISTKILLFHGLSPMDILFYRFLMAYIVIWFFSPHKIWSDRVKDELLFLAAGICGGSVYFMTENTALGITLASNVALIICTTPILTTLASYFLLKGIRLKQTLIYGSVIALAGVALVVFNGSFILKISPLGDVLTITAALMWAFYNIVLKQLDNRYSTLFITRKVFFYGLVTLTPCFYFKPLTTTPEILFQPVVTANLLFLGLIASMLCYIMWNKSVKQLGTIRTANYLYIVPLVTLITSSLVLDEIITPIAFAGTALILSGVYIAEKGWPFRLPRVKQSANQ